MSNILIIKHGSLGDLIQSNGAIEDIKNSFKESKVFLLTSRSYIDLMSQCPYLDGVIMDKRLPRWNFFYLMALKNNLEKYNFTHVFDLQNSLRTKFYKNFILNKPLWSSSESTLKIGQSKKEFDEDPVLERMEIQLKASGIKPNKIHQMDLSWTYVDITRMIKQYTNGEYILIFPFCSKKHLNKKWPYFKELTNRIKDTYKNKYSILIAPGLGEIQEAYELKAKVVLDNNEPVNLNILISLINKASFIISNDTGPAHICSHLNKNGLALFGSHTSAKKVSMGNNNFKTISSLKLSNLKADQVMAEVVKNLI